MKIKFKQFTAIVATIALSAYCSGQTLLIQESFDGSGSGALNTKAATSFSTDITDAGGSNVWAARIGGYFKDDGTVVVGPNSYIAAAYLNLGSYINSAKGTDNGIFTLQATINTTSSVGWISMGFFSTLGTEGFFVNNTPAGIATALVRGTSEPSGGNEFFAGPKADNGFNLGAITGSTTYTIVLDLSSDAYDGITDFGRVTYYVNESSIAAYTYQYTSTFDVAGLGFSKTGDTLASTGLISDMTLTQIPEPRTYTTIAGCLGLGVVFFVRCRKKAPTC